MKHCHNCNKPNRPEAKYCKWCGALLDDAPSAHGRTGGTDDFIGKDNILEDFGKKYVTACRLEEDFRNNNGEDSGSNLNCIITGDTGTGKAFLARKIAGLLYGCRLSDSPEATVKDASDWNEFNTRLDDNLAAIGRGVLVVTNCQKLVSPGERISQLDDKMVAMTRFSATDLLTSKFTEGVKFKSQVFRIQINDVNVRLAMLLNNEIDAVWLPEPQATEARLKGHNVIADSRDKKKVLGVLAFRAEVMNDSHRKKQLSAFTKAYDMACDSINKNGLQHYSAILKKHYGIDDKVIKALPKIKYNHIKQPRTAEVENIVR